jgi:hypothetical protein
MTLDEAQKIAAILAEADDGCSQCVGDLVSIANHKFPEFEWTMRDSYPPVVDVTERV